MRHMNFILLHATVDFAEVFILFVLGISQKHMISHQLKHYLHLLFFPKINHLHNPRQEDKLLYILFTPSIQIVSKSNTKI